MVDAAEEEDDAATAQTAKLRKEDALRRMREMIPTQTEVKLNNSNMMSMEDIVKRNDVVAQKLAQLTPREVLLKLQQGNSRFWMGLADRPEMSAMERRALIMQQTPKVAVLGCSDSRVPIEIVFDQGLGDIFAIRVAGNVYGGPVKGSVEYAVAVLKVKLVVVMGHEGCGAVRAAGTPMTAEKAASVPLVTELLNEIKSGLDNNRSIDSIRDGRARDREAVVTHVLAQMRRLMKGCEVVAKAVQDGELLVVGAFYEISSGMVDFFELGAADCETCDEQPPEVRLPASAMEPKSPALHPATLKM